jgi:hypothetical protein
MTQATRFDDAFVDDGLHDVAEMNNRQNPIAPVGGRVANLLELDVPNDEET